jgi:hypothetical protein
VPYQDAKATAPPVESSITLVVARNAMEQHPVEIGDTKRRAKAPKANLRELVRAGLLRDGQDLTLVDYQGVKQSDYRASVAGSNLRFNGTYYSMSDLARELLKKLGYQSESVRGPAHWATAEGMLIRDLWHQYRNLHA